MTDNKKESEDSANEGGEGAKPKKPQGGSVQARGVPGFMPKNAMKPANFPKGGGRRTIMKLSPRGR